MYYAQLFHRIDGEFMEILGSQGVVPLDGRLSFVNMFNVTEKRIDDMKLVCQVDGYQLMRGLSYSKSSPIERFIPYSNHNGVLK